MRTCTSSRITCLKCDDQDLSNERMQKALRRRSKLSEVVQNVWGHDRSWPHQRGLNGASSFSSPLACCLVGCSVSERTLFLCSTHRAHDSSSRTDRYHHSLRSPLPAFAVRSVLGNPSRISQSALVSGFYHAAQYSAATAMTGRKLAIQSSRFSCSLTDCRLRTISRLMVEIPLSLKS